MHDANQITLLDTKINIQFLKNKIISKITEKTRENPKKSITREKSAGKLDVWTVKHGRVRSEFCGIFCWNFIEEGSRNTNIEREIIGKNQRL